MYAPMQKERIYKNLGQMGGKLDNLEKSGPHLVVTPSELQRITMHKVQYECVREPRNPLCFSTVGSVLVRRCEALVIIQIRNYAIGTDHRTKQYLL